MTALKDPATGKFVSANASQEDKAAAAKLEADNKTAIPALEELSKRFMPDGKPPVVDDEKKKADDLKAAADKKAAEDKKKVTPRKPAPTATEQALERTTAALEKVVEHTTKKTDVPLDKKADDIDPLADLAPNERRKVNVLKQMEKDFDDNPQYKGIADKFIDGRKKFKKYVDDWQAAHPGETFDAEGEDHQKFLDSIDVNWDDDDFIESLTNMKMKTTAAVEEREKKLNSKLSEVERAQKVITEQPKILSESISAGRNFWKNFGEDVADVLSQTGVVDVAKLTEIQKANPTRINVAIAAAQKVEGLTAEIYKLLNGLEVYNEENQTHKHLYDFSRKKEQELLARASEEQKDASGRPFKTRPEYRKLPDEERKKYWTFSAADFGALLAHEEANAANTYLEQRDKEFREEAAARGIKLEDKPANGTKTGAVAIAKGANDDPENEDGNADDDDGKPRSPATQVEPKVAATSRRGTGTQTDPLDSFLKKQIAKS